MEASTVPTETYINGEPIAADSVMPTPEPEETVLEHHNEQLDDLELQIETREWIVEGQVKYDNPRTRQEESLDFKRTYFQKPLSYTAMLQFTGLIGDRIATVMGQGVTLESVLGDAQMLSEVFRPGSGITRDDFASVDSFVQGLAKLTSYLPTLVEECQCIWLRVPLHERPIVSDIWGRAPEDGGQSMQDGEEMLNLFIAQNYQELEDFFVERLPRILRKAQATRKRKSRSADRQPQ